MGYLLQSVTHVGGSEVLLEAATSSIAMIPRVPEAMAPQECLRECLWFRWSCGRGCVRNNVGGHEPKKLAGDSSEVKGVVKRLQKYLGFTTKPWSTTVVERMEAMN